MNTLELNFIIWKFAIEIFMDLIHCQFYIIGMPILECHFNQIGCQFNNIDSCKKYNETWSSLTRSQTQLMSFLSITFGEQ